MANHKHKGEIYKDQALRAAKDLGYDEEVIKDIHNAKSDLEIDRIMRNARLEKFG